ncbi:hypothetical protein P7K49_012404 [Saguinus oedipus]|uniref:Uncharacterized protein n=1 Tax=Saguinus oedipus TaxID=9490 RepID=A0ABQ9VWZ1_SAGOE|nr:hypothetical protein P7K49_012404 [Saguinus oedipus]
MLMVAAKGPYSWPQTPPFSQLEHGKDQALQICCAVLAFLNVPVVAQMLPLRWTRKWLQQHHTGVALLLLLWMTKQEKEVRVNKQGCECSCQELSSSAAEARPRQCTAGISTALRFLP